ncbi:HdeD family acid-resistance protein [Altererythrobacter lauratis]|uniref:HdeD family acid-resistance protein n=1 Tax=Alteraurantiacibacter lauratis TaxID=2054627 RepID=A0ABV7EG82_9SPHN
MSTAFQTCSLSRNWWVFALRGVLALVFAALALALPGSALFALTIVFGAFAFVDGLFGLIAAWRRMQEGERWGVLALSGVMGVLAGIVVVIWPLLATIALALLFWWSLVAWALVTGVLELVAAIRLRREISGEIWLGLSGALSVIFGVLLVWLLFTNPLASLVSLGWVVAFYAALSGTVQLLLALRLRRIARAGGAVEVTIATVRDEA